MPSSTASLMKTQFGSSINSINYKTPFNSHSPLRSPIITSLSDSDCDSKSDTLAERKTPCNTFLLSSNFVYNFYTTFIKTGYATAIQITELSGGKKVVRGMSAAGMTAGIFLGLYFGICESYAHNAQNKHLNNIRTANDPSQQSTLSKALLMAKQCLLAGGHFVSDVVAGVEPVMLFAEKELGFDTISLEWRIGIYLAMYSYSLIGNLQDLKNTYIAFKEENGEALASVDEESLLVANARSCSETFLLRSHFFFNFSNTFIKTGYSNALLITDFSGGERTVGKNLSWPGVSVGILSAIYFSLCESYAHNSESKHFNRSHHDADDLENAMPASQSHSANLTPLQYLVIIGHFLGDVIAGVEAVLFLATNDDDPDSGFNALPQWGRVLIYLTLYLSSFLGNLIEWYNTINATKEENAQAALPAPQPRLRDGMSFIS